MSDASDNQSDCSELEQESCDEYVGPVLPGGHRFDKKLLSIRYPGNVINADKAIETLGGIAEVSAATKAKNRRLELRFRPNDGFCKPACGDKHSVVGFLLRVRVKKNRIQKHQDSLNKNGESDSSLKKHVVDSSHTDNVKYNSASNPEDNVTNSMKECTIECSSTKKIVQHKKNSNPPSFDSAKYENLSQDEDYRIPKWKILGKLETEFRFTSLCDFQYLPIAQDPNDPKKYDCIYEDVYPVGIPPFSWMKKDVPYFLPPTAFSRMDSVQQYVPKTETTAMDSTNIIGKTRKRRAGLSNYINFNAPHCPTLPPKGIETAMKVKFLQTSHLETMKKLFEERPIWSKNAVGYHTNFTNEQLKVLLPSVAYYFMNGPWRITWVRLGYDPRRDPEARKYQTLDYRLKEMHGLHSNIKAKRSCANYTLPYRSTPKSKARTTVLSATSSLGGRKKVKQINENVYIYREGTIPPSRQMFYQYCDVYIPEVEEMLRKYKGPAPGTLCHEKRGWFPVGFDDICREMINKHVKAVIRKHMNIPESPTKLPLRSLRAKKVVKKKKATVKKPIKREPIKREPFFENMEDEMRHNDDIEILDLDWQDVSMEEPLPSTSRNCEN